MLLISSPGAALVGCLVVRGCGVAFKRIEGRGLGSVLHPTQQWGN